MAMHAIPQYLSHLLISSKSYLPWRGSESRNRQGPDSSNKRGPDPSARTGSNNMTAKGPESKNRKGPNRMLLLLKKSRD